MLEFSKAFGDAFTMWAERGRKRDRVFHCEARAGADREMTGAHGVAD